MFPNENHRGQSRYVLLWLACAFASACAATLAGAPQNPQGREQALAYFREGNGLLDRSRFAEAAAAFTKAVELLPDFAEAFHNRAVAREMVDRPLAIEDWRRFVELSEGVEARRFDVARARARLQILEAMPPLPEAMHPSRYDTGVGDYYWLVSRTSESELWPRLPVKVFLGRAPEHKWQEGVREAYDTWAALFPMQLTALPKDADIRMVWHEPTSERGHAGETYEYVRIELEGDRLSGRRVALIVVDQSRNWSKGEMRAIILHELGHALGIKGHSDSREDIMFWQMRDDRRSISVPGMPFPIFWRSLAKAPSRRDLNTLIRLYNTAGTVTRFQ
jgi:predicted Zn-dependent protease